MFDLAQKYPPFGQSGGGPFSVLGGAFEAGSSPMCSFSLMVSAPIDAMICLFGTNFDHVNTVLLMTKYDPE